MEDEVKKALSTRPFGKTLTLKEKDYLRFAFKKVNSNFFKVFVFHDDNSDLLLFSSLQIIVARLLVEACRVDEACPFKALLPEYTGELIK